MVALAVVALTLSAVITAASVNASNAAYLRDKTLAHWVAMNRVTEIQLGLDSQPAGRRRGIDEMADRDWFWRIRVVTTPDPNTRRLEVEVRAEEGAQDPLVRLVAFVSV
jgi:general secretion pathway protein I